MTQINTTAIILAAGSSSRMGGFKPLMPLGNRTVIEHIVGLFHNAGIRNIRVVVGYRAADVASALKTWNVDLVLNASYSDGMFSSVKCGVESLEPDCDAFFVHPTDIPLVRPETMTALSAAYQPNHILYPLFEKRRGHPPLIPGGFASLILNFSGRGGLRSALKQMESDALEVAVADEGILLDMDTPEDYQRVLAKYRRFHVPTPKECLALMTEIFQAEQQIIDHCQQVAKVATALGRAIRQAGTDVDLDLIAAAGLLHDLAKKQADHARKAEQILSDLGYPAVADIVGCHMDILLDTQSSIGEKEVVYLADKLVKGNRIVDLEARFKPKISRYACDPHTVSIIKNRLGNALMIQCRLEQLTRRSLGSIIEQHAAESSR